MRQLEGGKRAYHVIIFNNVQVHISTVLFSLAWEIRKADTSLDLLTVESIKTLRDLVEAFSKDSVGEW